MTESLDRPAARREWAAHWRVPVAAMLAVTAGMAHFGTIGVFLPEVARETGWSRSEITAGMMIYSVECIIAAPFIGMLVDRFGPRRIGIPGLILYLAAVALLAFTGPSIWTWWGGWMLIGVGGSLSKFNVWTTAVSRHFDQARGTAIAMALAGTSLGGMLMPLAAALAIRLADWRTGYVAIAAFAAATAVPVAMLWFSDGARPGAAGPAKAGRDPELREAILSLSFLRFLVISLAVFLPLSAINVHFVPIMRESGLGAGLAATMAAVMGGAALLGQGTAGWLLDRFPGKRVFAAFLLLGMIAMGALLASHLVAISIMAAVAVGLLNGAGPPSLAYLCSRHFPLRFFGTIFASMAGVMSLSAGLGAFIGGTIFDRAGGYAPLLGAALPSFLLGILLILSLGQYGNAGSRQPE